jgi:hypothetical protein
VIGHSGDKIPHDFGRSMVFNVRIVHILHKLAEDYGRFPTVADISKIGFKKHFKQLFYPPGVSFYPGI